jgi:hypothetical protein
VLTVPQQQKIAGSRRNRRGREEARYWFSKLEGRENEWVIEASAPNLPPTPSSIHSSTISEIPDHFVLNYKFPENFNYDLKEQEDGSIELFVPYVPYRHFQQSRAYLYGKRYAEYIDRLNWIRGAGSHEWWEKGKGVRVNDSMCMIPGNKRSLPVVSQLPTPKKVSILLD